MRSSRPQKARAKDDRLRNSFDGIFRIEKIITIGTNRPIMKI